MRSSSLMQLPLLLTLVLGSTDTKKLIVIFDRKIFSMSTFAIIKFEFDVSKMTVNDKVAF